MKTIFSRFIQYYGFSPTKVIVGGLIFICLLEHVVCYVQPKPFYKKNDKICFYCPPGTFWTNDCSRTMTEAQCDPCPTNHFQKSPNIASYCKECTSCKHDIRNHEFAEEIQPCTTVSDTICGCKSTHHFVKDVGGLGRGYCKPNSMCVAGTGVDENATHYADTRCKECVDGHNFSSSVSFDSCMPCSTACPNKTHVQHPCIKTHDLRCNENEELLQPTDKDVITRSRSSEISPFTIVVVSVLVIAIPVLFVYFLCRKRTSEGSRGLPILLNGKTFNEDAPSWMKQFIEDDSVNWMGLFGYCSSQDLILPDWESFIQRLFRMFHCADKGDKVIERVQESYERNKLSTRIYESLKLWKQKCFTDDVEMFNLFAEAYQQHISSTERLRSVLCLRC